MCGAVVLVGAACSDGDGETSTTRLPAPDVVVREWASAVAGGDVAALRASVASESLAFVVGIESRLTPDEITSLADGGFTDELVSGFWRSFSETFSEIDGATVDDLAIGQVREFDAAGARYAAVTVGEDGRTTEILVRRSLEGRWEVDVLATVGPGLVFPLIDLASEATDDRFRTLFEQWVFPALEAASIADATGEVATVARDVRLAFDSSR